MGRGGADAADARRSGGPCAEREPDHQGGRTRNRTLRLCETPDVGQPAAAALGVGQLPALDRQVGNARRNLVRSGQHVRRAGRPVASAFCTANLPDDEAERHADGGGGGSGPGLAHHAGGGSEESVLQHPAGRTIARSAARIAGDGTADRGRHETAIRQRPGVGIRPADRAGTAEQPAPDHPADGDVGQAGETAAEDVPFDTGRY